MEKPDYQAAGNAAMKEFIERLTLPEKNWENISNKDGFKVTKYTKKDQYLVRVEKLFEGISIEELKDFIHDDKNRPIWDTNTERKELLEESNVDDGIYRVVYAVSKATPMISTRDFVTLQHNKMTTVGNDKCFVQVHTHTTHPSKPSKETIGVRGKVQISGWMFKPEADIKTLLVYTSGVDIGGWLPTSVVNHALESGTLEVVQSIAKHYKK